MELFDASIREMSHLDLAMVRVWRNHPEVRRYMYNNHEISSDEHIKWFEQAINDSARKLLIVEDHIGPLGFAQFSGVRVGGVADWGFYVRPAAPKGSGSKLGFAVLNHGFTALELHKICGQVIYDNLASRAFHAKMGFREEGVLREHQIIEGVRHNVICYGLLKAEWRNKSDL